MSKKVLFSGIQPTGNLHIGNYLGAIQRWKNMQYDYNSIFCIVDMHAITVGHNPKELHQAIIDTAIAYVASGIDPKSSIIFNQSMVAAHAELAWILGCITPIGWLNRMTQFKEKSAITKDMSSLGLYGYPVLMASDILIYNTDVVPVGEDQKQHIELARDIAGAFNHQFSTELFTLPEPVITGVATRVMSLRDGTKKMSKSDASDLARINLSDDNDVIVQKIKKAKSDSIAIITYDKQNRPEVTNLINLFAAFSDLTVEEVVKQFDGLGSASFKSALAELIITKVEPIRTEIERLYKDLQYINKILSDGAEKANAIAEPNMRKIKDTIGFFQG
jgi:tryptophanyl-tRNA synthetase